MTTHTLSWSYVAGLIETDGSLGLYLAKDGSFLVTIFISSQTKHTGLLELLEAFFHSVDILARIQKQSSTEKTTRAPKIRIRGPRNVLKFILLMEKNTQTIPFCSQKLRDFFIIKQALLNRKLLSPAEKIDLLMSLHKTHQNEVDISK